MHYALTLEVPRQWLPAPALIRPSLCARGGLGAGAIAILVIGHRCFGSRLPRLPGTLRTTPVDPPRVARPLAGAFGVQQFPQQVLDLAPLGRFPIQLSHQIQHHPL
jgi:hypothetical protein